MTPQFLTIKNKHFRMSLGAGSSEHSFDGLSLIYIFKVLFGCSAIHRDFLCIEQKYFSMESIHLFRLLEIWFIIKTILSFIIICMLNNETAGLYCIG